MVLFFCYVWFLSDWIGFRAFSSSFCSFSSDIERWNVAVCDSAASYHLSLVTSNLAGHILFPICSFDLNHDMLKEIIINHPGLLPLVMFSAGDFSVSETSFLWSAVYWDFTLQEVSIVVLTYSILWITFSARSTVFGVSRIVSKKPMAFFNNLLAFCFLNMPTLSFLLVVLQRLCSLWQNCNACVKFTSLANFKMTKWPTKSLVRALVACVGRKAHQKPDWRMIGSAPGAL